jgi:hypothetical protein
VGVVGAWAQTRSEERKVTELVAICDFTGFINLYSITTAMYPYLIARRSTSPGEDTHAYSIHIRSDVGCALRLKGQ